MKGKYDEVYYYKVYFHMKFMLLLKKRSNSI